MSASGVESHHVKYVLPWRPVLQTQHLNSNMFHDFWSLDPWTLVLPQKLNDELAVCLVTAEFHLTMNQASPENGGTTKKYAIEHSTQLTQNFQHKKPSSNETMGEIVIG